MPLVFSENSYRFHFYSREGEPREPMHVHIAKRGEGDAKLWLYPEVAIAYSHGFDARTQRWMTAVVRSHREAIEKAWHEHFGSGD